MEKLYLIGRFFLEISLVVKKEAYPLDHWSTLLTAKTMSRIELGKLAILNAFYLALLCKTN